MSSSLYMLLIRTLILPQLLVDLLGLL